MTDAPCYNQFDKSEFDGSLVNEKIMFGNSLMLLGIAIMILAGLKLIYIGIIWASFLLIPIGFIVAVTGFFSKDN